MTIHYRQQGSVLIIFGNTYPERDRIKALGGRYNGVERNWLLPYSEAALEQVTALCRSVGGGHLGAAPAAVTPGPTPPEVAGALALESAVVGTASGTLSGAVEVPAGLTIRQLMDRAAAALNSAFPELVWVTAEVQNLAQRPNAVYFDLAEGREGTHANATVTARAILWRGSLRRIQERRGEAAVAEALQEGLAVRVLCRVQLYRDRGQISLVVEDLDPSYTKGALALARERLLRELRAKGLDVAQKRLVLTPFPFRVGLISAEGSRAESDFLDQLFSLGFPGEVVFCPTPMQGEAVPRLVVRALERLQALGLDLIVITRGGGSAADLRWFDAPEIAYAIARARVPVVAAIGHHEDVAVAEEICFLRQKTPTAAADFVVGWFLKTRQRIEEQALELSRGLGRRIEEFALLMATLSERLAFTAERAIEARHGRLAQHGHALQRASLERVHGWGSRITEAKAALRLATEAALAHRLTQIDGLERLLSRRDPSPWLAQGWTQLFGPAGLVRGIHQVNPGDQLAARLADGRLRLEVAAVEAALSPTSEAPK